VAKLERSPHAKHFPVEIATRSTRNHGVSGGLGFILRGLGAKQLPRFLFASAAWLLISVARAQETNAPLSFSRIVDFQQYARTNSGDVRVKVRGTVTYQNQKRSVYVQDSTAGTYAFTRVEQPLEIGDEIEVTGNASRAGFSPSLYSCAFRKIGPGQLPAPKPLHASGIMAGEGDMELIRISGKLVSRHLRGNAIVLTLVADAIAFPAEFISEQPIEPFPNLAMGSVVQIVGICSIKPEAPSLVRGFEVLLRTPADLQVISGPSWWTTRRLVALVLCAIVFAAVAMMWVLQLRAQVERRTLEVRSLNRDLERRVEERTRELHLANQKLAATNRELEAFSYSVSHDLKAPLRAISGFTRAIADEHAQHLDVSGKQLLERVEANTGRMGRLIDDLLLFSRAAHASLKTTVLDMEEIFRRAAEELTAAHKGQSIEFRIQPLPKAHGDLAMIKQVVANLLSNAVKFSHTRPATIIEIGCEERGALPTYFVKDNGVGFDPANVNNLFSLFQRLHGREYEGTGAGLAIVQRIVTRHGGTVSAEGKLNDGAIFRFSLP
jgi:signal transduction histidine kinase